MPRLPSLTSARFFAAMYVVAFHSVPFIGIAALIPVFRIGYVGVSFFFALSGFVLTWGTAPGLGPRTFFRRRFARIWPLLAVVLVAWFILDSSSAGHSVSTEAARSAAALLLLQAWVPHSEWYFGNNGVTWSLSAEAFFYALTPWLLRRRLPTPIVLLVAVVALAIIAQIALTIAMPGNAEQWVTYIAPPAGLPAFVAGHLLARAMKSGAIPRVPGWLAVAAPLACLSIGVLFLNHKVHTGTSPFFFMGGIATIALPGWLVLIAALARTDMRGGSLLARRSLVRLGEWSYALYLLHPLVIHLFDVSGYDNLGAPRFMLTLGIWVTAVGASGLAYVLVERPAEDRLRGGRPTRPLPPDVAEA